MSYRRRVFSPEELEERSNNDAELFKLTYVAPWGERKTTTVPQVATTEALLMYISEFFCLNSKDFTLQKDGIELPHNLPLIEIDLHNYDVIHIVPIKEKKLKKNLDLEDISQKFTDVQTILAQITADSANFLHVLFQNSPTNAQNAQSEFIEKINHNNEAILNIAHSLNDISE